MAVLSWDAEKLAIAEFFQFPRSTASPQVAGDSELRRVCGFWCIELDAWIDPSLHNIGRGLPPRASRLSVVFTLHKSRCDFRKRAENRKSLRR